MKKAGVALIVLLQLCAVQALARSEQTLALAGVDYVCRWSEGNQHEFTPPGQEDLDSWQDMVTIVVYPEVTDGEALARVANNVLSLYRTDGKILRTDAVPRTRRSPAEHYIAAVLGSPQFLEAVHARFKIVEGKGTATVWSHRIYGKDVGPAMSEWLREQGLAREKALLAWDAYPALDSLGE